MANTQSGSLRGVESRSHDGVTLRSGRRIQYESPVARRNGSPSLERNHGIFSPSILEKASTSLGWSIFCCVLANCSSLFSRVLIVPNGVLTFLSALETKSLTTLLLLG